MSDFTKAITFYVSADRVDMRAEPWLQWISTEHRVAIVEAMLDHMTRFRADTKMAEAEEAAFRPRPVLLEFPKGEAD